MDADSAMGDSFDDHCSGYLDAEERTSMLSGGGHDGSSSGGSSRVSGGYHDSSSPDAGYCSPVASAVAPSGKHVVVVTGRLRGRELNDKLYALRSVVPNITKMDKASIIKDAIAYIQHLQEEERRMLAEIAILESSSPAIHGQQDGAHHAMKKMRRFQSTSSAVTSTSASAMAATSRRIEALQVSVTGAGDKVLLVSVACRYRKDAMARVLLALDRLRLAVISATVTSASGIMKHTALVQRGETHPSEMKEAIETTIAQVDAVESTLSTNTSFSRLKTCIFFRKVKL